MQNILLRLFLVTLNLFFSLDLAFLDLLFCINHFGSLELRVFAFLWNYINCRADTLSTGKLNLGLTDLGIDLRVIEVYGCLKLLNL